MPLDRPVREVPGMARKVTLYVDQGRRDRIRYRVVKATNSVAFQMGRLLSQTDLRHIMDQGIEVIVTLRKGE